METITCRECDDQVHSIELHLKKAHPEVSLSMYRGLHQDAPLLSEKARCIIEADAAKRAETKIVVSYVEQPSSKQQMTGLFELSSPLNNGRGQPLEITVLNPASELEPYIPAIDNSHVWDSEDLKNMAMALELNIPLYLYGHKGTGKTSNFCQLAARTRRPLLRVQHTVGTEEAHILGQWTIQGGQTVFELGPLALAMKHGWIYLADEYDMGMPGTLAVYQPVLEGAPLVIKEADLANRVIKPHPNFRFWANGNTNGSGDESGLYSGTVVQNSANYDRFGMMLEVHYMPAAQETQIILNRCPGMSQKEAAKLVGLAGKIREQFKGGSISDTISTRALVNIANVGLRRGDMMVGIKLCFSNKLSKIDKAVIDGVSQRLYSGTAP